MKRVVLETANKLQECSSAYERGRISYIRVFWVSSRVRFCIPRVTIRVSFIVQPLVPVHGGIPVV